MSITKEELKVELKILDEKIEILQGRGLRGVPGHRLQGPHRHL